MAASNNPILAHLTEIMQLLRGFEATALGPTHVTLTRRAGPTVEQLHLPLSRHLIVGLVSTDSPSGSTPS